MNTKAFILGPALLVFLVLAATSSGAQTLVPGISGSAGGGGSIAADSREMAPTVGVVHAVLWDDAVAGPLYTPVAACGRVWVPPHTDRYGRFHPGHFRYLHWVPGHYNGHGVWIPGQCR